MSSLAVLLVNPAAGAFRPVQVDKLTRLLRGHGFTPEVFVSQERGGVQKLAEEVRTLSPHIVFVLGGDGTFNEAANGLVHSDIPVSFVPLGTTNVVAQELGIPIKIERAVEQALGRKAQTISLGKVSGKEGTRYFIMMAGIGFDADAVYRVNARIKRLSGKLSYVWSGLKTVMNYHPTPIGITSSAFRGTGYAVIVGNGSRYGGKFRITPDASLFEPVLSVFVLKSESRAALLKTVYRVIRSEKTGPADGAYFTTERISLAGDAPIQVDGDYLGRLPLDISLEPNCLKIIC